MSRQHRHADLHAVFFALADPNRRAIVERLSHAPHRASELASALSTSRPGMSKHLRILRDAGIVKESSDEQDGRARQLTLAPTAFDVARDFLDRVEDVWSAQLDAFKQRVEAVATERRGASRRHREAS